MADEFAQLVKGATQSGATIVSTDGLTPVSVKKGTTWVPLEVDSSTGELPVAFTGDVTVVQPTAANLNVTVEPGTNPIDVTGTVAVSGLTGDVAVVNGSTAFAVTDDALDYTTDNVAIKGATGNQLVVNSDGSLNVAMSGAGSSNIYHPGSVTLVKDTPNTVVTRSPAATEHFKAIMVSGAGLCHWTVKYGTTAAEAAIMDFWTTPSCPTQYIDIPDSLDVTSTQTILIVGENKEKAASTGSDFTGYATLIRNA